MTKTLCTIYFVNQYGIVEGLSRHAFITRVFMDDLISHLKEMPIKNQDYHVIVSVTDEDERTITCIHKLYIHSDGNGVTVDREF